MPEERRFTDHESHIDTGYRVTEEVLISDEREDLDTDESTHSLSFLRTRGVKIIGGALGGAALFLLGGNIMQGGDEDEEEDNPAVVVGTPPEGEEQMEPMNPVESTAPPQDEVSSNNQDQSVEAERGNRYESPFTGEVRARESWIRFWRTEMPQINGNEIGSPATQEHVDITRSHLGRKIGIPAPQGELTAHPEDEVPFTQDAVIFDNVVFLYEQDGEILTIERPFVYGMRFTTGEGGGPSVAWSWDPRAEEYTNYSVMFPHEGNVEQFTIVDDPQVRWFSQPGSRMIGLFYTSSDAMAELARIDTTEMVYMPEEESWSVRHERIGIDQVAAVAPHESEWDAWEYLEEKYPNLEAVELSGITNISK